jgi:hypothetical protein
MAFPFASLSKHGIPLGEDLDPNFDPNHATMTQVCETRKHPGSPNPTTINSYHQIVKGLRRDFLQTFTFPESVHATPMDLVSDLLSKSLTFRPKTYLLYRAALHYWLELLPDYPEKFEAIEKLMQETPRDGFKGAKPDQSATLYSSQSSRPRTFSRQQFERLTTELSKRASVTGRHTPDGIPRASTLLAWLHAGLASGLRPIEWEDAQWHDAEKTTLRVRSAKRRCDDPLAPTHTERLPEYRLVPIDAADQPWVEQHLDHLARYKLAGGTFKHFYNNNRATLSRLCTEIFGPAAKKFTLYLMRGQFAANRKRRQGADEVAMEMGCSTEIVYRSYGRKSAGHRAGRNTPAPTRSSRPKPKPPVSRATSRPSG